MHQAAGFFKFFVFIYFIFESRYGVCMGCTHRTSKTAAMVKESNLAAVPHTIHNAQVMIAAIRKAVAASGLFAG